jgi:hypothetical protein
MYVVRLKSIDGTLEFGAFISRSLAQSSFETGRDQVIDERLDESALFDVASLDDPKTAVRLAREGRASLLRIYPPPMTEAQAAAWLAGFGL